MVTSLPYFHPRETEPGHETTHRAKAGQWVVAKIARELGINVTGGSSSVVDAWDVLRLAAATARARLLGAASIALKQPAGELVVQRRRRQPRLGQLGALRRARTHGGGDADRRGAPEAARRTGA